MSNGMVAANARLCIDISAIGIQTKFIELSYTRPSLEGGTGIVRIQSDNWIEDEGF